MVSMHPFLVLHKPTSSLSSEQVGDLPENERMSTLKVICYLQSRSFFAVNLLKVLLNGAATYSSLYGLKRALND